jgi:glycine cleavage system aminomethyltransferase T
VAKALRGLRFGEAVKELPVKDAKIFLADKEVGYITSAVHSPRMGRVMALGYVRREANEVGRVVQVEMPGGKVPAEIVGL